MDRETARIFERYPGRVRAPMKRLRALIFEVACENAIDDLHECLKWGEPGYITRSGSTVRIDWKETSPDRCFVFFHCRTRLVETFRKIYPSTFEYEGHRAIVLSVDENLPEVELKHCISMALNYHRLKHFPLLGA